MLDSDTMGRAYRLQKPRARVRGEVLRRGTGDVDHRGGQEHHHPVGLLAAEAKGRVCLLLCLHAR